MIFNILSILVVLYCIIDFKMGYITFIGLQVIWYQSTLFTIGGINLTTYVFCPITISIIYLFKRKNIIESRSICPYLAAFIAVAISYLVTSFCAYAGFFTEFNRLLSNYLRTFFIFYLSWNVLETYRDFKNLYKLLTYIMFFACVYGIFEYVTHLNPIYLYKVSLSGGSIHEYDMSYLRGYRISSIFEHPIGAGMTFGLYSMFTFVSWIKFQEKIPNEKFSLLTAVLCIPCVVLSKMRSAILFTAILALPLINPKIFKKKRLYIILGLIALASPIIIKVFSSNIKLITSFFTSYTRDNEVGGSSVDMRMEQLYASLQLMKMSPIGGLGETFKGLITNSYTVLARDFESVWLEQIAMHGVIGVIATIILLITTTFIVPFHYRSISSFFFFFSYWLTYSLSSVPSFRIVLLYCSSYYFIKKTNVYRDEQKKKRKKRLLLRI